MKTPLVTLVEAAVDDIKALDRNLIDVRELTTITDYMLVCTGTSNRHVKSIADNIISKAKEAGFRPLGVEGMDAGEWVLVDLGDVVAHVMQAQARAFYQLEKLWDVPPPAAADAAKPAKSAKSAKSARSGKGKARKAPAKGGRGKPRGRRR